MNGSEEMEMRSFASAYRILVEDLLTLCEYIDPQDANLDCFSHRTFELLMRVCTELENLWKSFLREKKHRGDENRWNLLDYVKIESQYGKKLSTAEVAFVHWKCGSEMSYFQPYKGWTNEEQSTRLSWYKAYNSVKHAREKNFGKASFGNVILAFGALHVALVHFFGEKVFFPQPIPKILQHTRLEQAFVHFDIKLVRC